jgi:energy-converting hydrogenase Eha subunit E
MDAMQRQADAKVRFQREAQPLLDALEAAGIETVDFGRFGIASNNTFDFAGAAPIIVDWLPRIGDPSVKEAMVRSLAGQRAARGEGARRLLAEFNRPEYASHEGLRWAIGNTLATVAGPSDADAIIDILRDSRHGAARQMLCDALVRTRDHRRVEVLLDLIDDDDLAGHAISALRRISDRDRIAELMRPKLEAVLARPSATAYAKRQARSAMKALRSGADV